MKTTELIKLNNIDYFTKESLRSLSVSSEDVLSYDIARFIKAGKLIQLKKGLYVTNATFVKNLASEDFKKYLANNMYIPSYISLETVLSKYSILTDVTYNFWSVTLKTPQKFNNKLGTFYYKQIKKELYIGFNIISYGTDKHYFEATKAKALFDYLYYKSESIIDLSANLVEDLRLNLESFSDRNWKEFSGYIKLSESKKLKLIFENLKKNA